MSRTKAASSQQLDITGDIDMKLLYRIVQLLDPVNPQDSATKHYVDTHSGSGGSGTNSNVLIDGGSFTAPSENLLIDGGTF